MSDQSLTHQRVLRIAVPIVVSNATVPILGAVDTGVIGQLGQAAPIGAVGMGAVILVTFYWVFGFLRMGTTGLVAQARGAGDDAEVRLLFQRALMIGLVIGVALIAGQTPIFALAFQVSPASPEVETLTRSYLSIRVWSAPAAVALFGINGWLIAQERTREVLILQLWMNGLNIGLDLWFALGLGWGVQGVASATLIAEFSGLALGLWLCREALRGAPLWAQLFDRVKLWRMAQVNGDILLRSLMLQGIFVTFMFYGAGFGDQVLAANQVLLQFLEITAFALDGFAFAAEALVGQALGARAPSQVRRAALMTSFWGAICIGALVLLFALAGPLVIDLMTTAPDVRAAARDFLPWVLLAPVLGLPAWMLDGIFIGATRTRDMRNMMAICVVIYGAALYALVPFMGNHGLWAALLISSVARGVTLGLRYPALERAVA